METIIIAPPVSTEELRKHTHIIQKFLNGKEVDDEKGIASITFPRQCIKTHLPGTEIPDHINKSLLLWALGNLYFTCLNNGFLNRKIKKEMDMKSQVKRVKRTEIKYKKLPTGDIIIVDFKNASSYEMLKHTLGKFDCFEYLKMTPRYYYDPDVDVIVVCKDFNRTKTIKVGSTFTHEMFGDIVNTMRLAGKRLREIQDKQIEKERVKTIKI